MEGLQACSGTLGGAGIASWGPMVAEAKRKLKEALLAAALGPGTAEGSGRDEVEKYTVLNEIWHMIG